MGALAGVEMTAVAIAYGRAMETTRPDRLFADPWAQEFVRASGWTPPADLVAAAVRLGVDGGAAWVVVRTRFFDDVVMAAARGGCRQIVLLGAGLDTRALRLDWPVGIQVFEVDTAPVLDFKEAVLGGLPDKPPGGHRVLVRTDLTTPDWVEDLRGSGLDPTQASTWIAEGLLIYLTDEQNESLLELLSSLSPPGSSFATSLTPPGHLAEVRAQYSAAQGRASSLPAGDNPLSLATAHTMWRSDGPADPAGWLAGHGWDAQVFSPAERAHAYGRGQPPTDSPQPPRRLLVSASKQGIAGWPGLAVDRLSS